MKDGYYWYKAPPLEVEGRPGREIMYSGFWGRDWQVVKIKDDRGIGFAMSNLDCSLSSEIEGELIGPITIPEDLPPFPQVPEAATRTVSMGHDDVLIILFPQMVHPEKAAEFITELRTIGISNAIIIEDTGESKIDFVVIKKSI